MLDFEKMQFVAAETGVSAERVEGGNARPMPNYTATPYPHDLVHRDDRKPGPVWKAITFLCLVVSCGAGIALNMCITYVVARLYNAQLPVASSWISLTIITGAFILGTWRYRFDRFQCSTFVYPDRIVLKFADRTSKTIFASDVVRASQFGAALIVHSRVVVVIQPSERLCVWHIMSKSPEAIKKQQSHRTIVFFDDIFESMEALEKSWGISFGHRYNLRNQAMVPSVPDARRRLSLPAKTISWTMLGRRILITLFVLIVVRFLAQLGRVLLDLYAVGYVLHTCVSQETKSRGVCAKTVFEYYELFLGFFVMLYMFNIFWSPVARQVDVYSDRIRVQLRNGNFVTVLLKDVKLFRFSLPDIYVAPGSIVVYATQYHTVHYSERDLLSQVTVYKINSEIFSQNGLIRLVDGGQHPLLVLSEDDHRLFRAVLDELKSTTIATMKEYLQEFDRIKIEEAELRKVNRRLNLKYPEQPELPAFEYEYTYPTNILNNDTWMDWEESIQNCMERWHGRMVWMQNACRRRASQIRYHVDHSKIPNAKMNEAEETGHANKIGEIRDFRTNELVDNAAMNPKNSGPALENEALVEILNPIQNNPESSAPASSDFSKVLNTKLHETLPRQHTLKAWGTETSEKP